MDSETQAWYSPEYLAYLRWAAKHATELPTLLELCGDVFDSVGPGGKLRATAKVCEFMAPIADDFPVFSAASAGLDVSALESAETAAIEATAIDIGRLKALWPVIELLLPILLDRLRR